MGPQAREALADRLVDKMRPEIIDKIRYPNV